MPKRPKLQLFQLYKNFPQNPQRVDIEETENLADAMPSKAEELRKELFDELNRMDASFPYYNPRYKGFLPNKENICQPLAHGKSKNRVWAKFKERGAKVIKGQIAYTLNGSKKSEEWFVISAEIKGDQIIGLIPQGATHYVFNLIDENNFLVSHPEMPDKQSAGNRKGEIPYSKNAFQLN